MFYDLVLDYERIVNLPNDKILETLRIYFPDKKLYGLSVKWRNSREYILMAFGINGSITVGWSWDMCEVRKILQEVFDIETIKKVLSGEISVEDVKKSVE